MSYYGLKIIGLSDEVNHTYLFDEDFEQLDIRDINYCILYFLNMVKADIPLGEIDLIRDKSSIKRTYNFYSYLDVKHVRELERVILYNLRESGLDYKLIEHFDKQLKNMKLHHKSITHI